ncbi:MAG TPA: uroporphyrinogen decarboxylase family protein [Candidatus Methanomethylicus sp.]|nr:uroporphyrinogen decarboxylase family protein [Candidatus Methanomethylicus sp.]
MKDRLSSSERMFYTITGQKPDRIAVSPFVMGYAAKACGFSIGDFYSDPKKCFWSQLMTADMHGYDASPMYGYASVGAWEFGGKIGLPYEAGHGAPYVITHPVETPEDVDKLEIPSPENAGANPIMMGVAKQCNALGMPAVFQIGGFVTYCGNIMEPARMLLWMIRKPELVHKVINKVEAYQKLVVDWFINTFGAEKCMVFSGGATESNKLISPKQYETFALPHEIAINKYILDNGIHVVLMHPCADQNGNIPHYKKIREECGWRGKYVWNFGPETPLEKQIEVFGAHDIIGGNVDPPSFQTKSFDEIVMLCKDNIERGIKNPSGYILMPGCEMPPLTPPINIHAMMTAARKFGSFE